MDKLEEMLERVWVYYHEHETEIESANRYDGSNYILKELYNALLHSTNGIGLTETIKSEEERERHKRSVRYFELCQNDVVRAICEVIDSEFEGRIDELETESLKLRRDRDDWKEISSGIWDNFESGGF